MPTFPCYLCTRPPTCMFICLGFLSYLASPSLAGGSGLAFHISECDCSLSFTRAWPFNLESHELQSTLNLVLRSLCFCCSAFWLHTIFSQLCFLESQSHHGCTRQSRGFHKFVILLGFSNPDHHGKGGEAIHK